MSSSAGSRTNTHRAPLVWVAQGVWFENVFRGVSRFAHRHGWRLDASMRFSRGPVSPPSTRPDGIIVFTLDTPGLEAAVRSLHAEGVPVVDMEAYADRYGAPRVLGDDAQVGSIAATHLIGTHPSRLYAALPSTTGGVSRTRRDAFLRTAAESGIPATILAPGTFDVRDLVRDGSAGFYASSETIAAAVLADCLAAGIRVPEDLAILSGDDFGTVCENAPVPLSAIDLDMEEKGYRAAELLDRLMRGEKAPAKPVIVPPAGVFARESTRLFRTGDERLDALIRHLKDSCHRRAGLAELCEEAGLPLRTAQHLLKTKLGVSPGKLLRGYRLENAGRLEAGGLKKDAVAKAVGYGGRSGLARARKNKPSV